MTDELHNLDLFLDSDKSDADLLGELDALKGLLSESKSPAGGDDAIPVLNEVVSPAEEKPAAAPTARPAPRPPLPAAGTTTSAAAPAAAPMKEKELEVMVDRIIDKEMPRIRVELKRVLLAELRLRGVVK